MTDQGQTSLLDEIETPVEEVKEVMPRTVDDTPSVEHQIMDQADEDQIIEEIKGSMSGEMSDKWIYQFPNQGKTITGLSWVGTKELRYWMAKKDLAKITEMPEFSNVELVVINNVQFYQAKSTAKDLKTGIMASATVIQGFTKTKKDGSSYKLDTEFVPRIAESKAQRNAIQKLIPASQLAEFILVATQKGKVQALAPSHEGMMLTADDHAIALPYLNTIEKLQTVQECKVYWRQLDVLMGKLSGRVMHNIKSALTTKGNNLKEKEAKANVANITKEGGTV